MSSPLDAADRCECGGPRLESEASVPLAGFSRELRLATDVQRFRFSYPLRDVPLPVHVVFSASERRAEVKAGDLKAYPVEGVASACEAKRRWIEWWRRGRAGSFTAPRRSGRHPRPAVAAS